MQGYLCVYLCVYMGKVVDAQLFSTRSTASIVFVNIRNLYMSKYLIRFIVLIQVFYLHIAHSMQETDFSSVSCI